MYETGKLKILSLLGRQERVSITTDNWTDRSMRFFLGKTAHIIDHNDQQLKSILLSCHRFSGAYTGENIAEAFEKTIKEHNLQSNVTYAITDNATNMCKAFKVNFLSDNDLSDSVGDDDDDDDDDDDLGEVLWQDLVDSQQETVQDTLIVNSKKRLSCFVHSLQLCVRDGLKGLQGTGVSSLMSKIQRVVALLHKSTVVKEKFEEAFGTNSGIPSSNSTGWNSTYNELHSISNLDFQKLQHVCKECNIAAFSSREWTQIKELCTTLKPFNEATLLLQGDCVPTISLVVQTVLDLHGTVQAMKNENQTNTCKSLMKDLLVTVEKWFRGILI